VSLTIAKSLRHVREALTEVVRKQIKAGVPSRSLIS